MKLGKSKDIYLVSVVIPVHNRLKELKRSLDSVLNQTLQDIEIIVVDDASTVNVKSVIETYKVDKIKYIRLETKSNANVARNTGIKQSKGKFIALLDSDDAWKEDHLFSRIKILEENPLIDGVFGSFLINDINPRVARDLNNNESMIDYLLLSNPSGTPTLVLKKECAQDILFDPTIERHQDYDFIIRFSQKYKLKAVKLLSVIVYWDKIENIKTNFEHCMYFIDKYKGQINPKTYHSYHKEMYNKAKLQGAKDSIIKHYNLESVRYKKSISLISYLEWVKPIGIFSKIYHRVLFLTSNMI